ncbi:hypothetical protein OC709_01030, partial ['Planchonia careya' phytoplasma]
KDIQDLTQTKNNLETVKNQVIGDREQIITTRYQTISDLTEAKKTSESHAAKQKYILQKNVEKKTYLYFSKKIINLIQQYLKNLYFINNRICKLLFQQYSRIDFIIILCVINILFYFLLIKKL